MEEENYYRWDGNRKENTVISLYMPHYNVNKRFIDDIAKNPNISLTIEDNNATMKGPICEFFNIEEREGLFNAIEYAISAFAKKV